MTKNSIHRDDNENDSIITKNRAWLGVKINPNSISSMNKKPLQSIVRFFEPSEGTN